VNAARIYRFIVLLTCLALGKYTFASHPYHIHLNTTKGLPSSMVYDILQDKTGFIWLATEAGLCRYDGNNFVSYQSASLTCIAGSNLQVDKYGRIWYQNFDGYSYYVDNDTLRTLNQKGVFYSPNGITDDYIFVVENEGIQVYDIATLKPLKLFTFAPIHQIRYTGVAYNRFYFVFENKIGYINKDLKLEWLSYKLPEGFEIPIFAQSSQKLIIFSRNQSKAYIEVDSLGAAKIKAIDGIKDIILVGEVIQNSTWFCTTSGVYFNSAKRMQQWYQNERISCVIKDRQNNLWIGSLDNGLYIVPMMGKSYMPLPSSYASKLFIHDNRFWVFAGTQLCVLSKEGQLQYQKHVTSDNTLMYYAYFDTLNYRYFTSSFGMQIGSLNTNEKTNYEFALKEVIPLDHKYYLLAVNGSLFIKSRIDSQVHSKWDNLAKKEIVRQGERYRSISVSNEGNLYYSSNSGTYKITPDTSIEITFNDRKLFVQRMVSSKQGILALTASGQLMIIHKDKVTYHVDVEAQTGVKSYTHLIHYGEYILITGENKIIVLSEKDLSIVAIPPSFIRTTDIKDLCLQNDSLYILLHNGIVVQAMHAKPRNMTSDFVVHKTLLNNKTAVVNNTTLNHSQNNIQIQFSVLDFSEITTHVIKYKVNNASWNIIDPNVRQIQFASLSPGKYEIEFMLNGNIIDHAKLQFNIKKPIWLQWWFITICLMLGASLLYSYYRWQIQLIVKKNDLETEKLKLESALNKSMLTAIKSQMNPHFFYNALNTIQAYIFSNDKTNASNYLSKFSKLTRIILDMSGKERVKISEELEALQLYLDLERMRFDKDFTYSFDIDTNLDVELTSIPSLLIQPYVENAIKHGLLHKKGAKHVSISFAKTADGFLEIIVEDNGIGRKRSTELNKIKTQKHASFATQANQQRLEILNKGTNNKLIVVYDDKQTKDGLALGTKVTLRIPTTNSYEI
jgi:two-component sensor histidine kinase